MKKLFALVIATLFALSAPALAAGNATIMQEVFYVRPYSTYYAGDVFAELKNTGDKPVKFNGGMIELFDEGGNSIESNNIYSCYPPILGPGEMGYIFKTTTVKEAKEKSYIDDYSLTVTSKGENKKEIKYLSSDGDYRLVEKSYKDELVIAASIQNDTDAVLFNVTTVIALYDSNDKLIYADYISPSNIGVPPGQSLFLHKRVESKILDLWVENGITPVRIATIAYSEI